MVSTKVSTMRTHDLPILCLSALLASAPGPAVLTAGQIEAAEFSAEGFGEGPDPLAA